MAKESLVLLLGLVGLCISADIADFYPYGINIDNTLEINDDVASEKVVLGKPIVFFGSRKYELYVSFMFFSQTFIWSLFWTINYLL